MCHKLDIARDVTAALHTILNDDWFFSWSDECITETVRLLTPGQLKSTVTVATAILAANALTQYEKPGSETHRVLFRDICDAIDWLLNDYARFLGRQLELGDVSRGPARSRPVRRARLNADQRKAIEAYAARIAHVAALKGRDFPANVVDLVRYRVARAL